VWDDSGLDHWQPFELGSSSGPANLGVPWSDAGRIVGRSSGKSMSNAASPIICIVHDAGAAYGVAAIATCSTGARTELDVFLTDRNSEEVFAINGSAVSNSDFRVGMPQGRFKLTLFWPELKAAHINCSIAQNSYSPRCGSFLPRCRCWF
jgi:hypothetical protein